jgi:uncharacterized membrane protein YgcG
MLRLRSYTKMSARAFTHGLLVAVFLLIPATVRAEIIESFVADIEVRKDATFSVTEHIDYTFEGEKHGIFRYIPTMHQEQPRSIFRERYTDVDVESVTMDGEPVPFQESAGGGQIFLKIGDPNSTITGTHRYEISYTVEGGLSYEENGGAELYWNVTGNGWEVPMRYVEVRVTSPDGILLRERACYRGPVGEANSCERVTEENGTVIFSGSLFPPQHGLTVAQALSRTATREDIRERYKPLLLWGLIVLVGLVTGGVSLYRYKTKFDTDAPIIPQYEPYPGVKPMYAGLLFDKRLDPRDITAGIVYLAEQGFIKIKKIDTKVLFFFEVDDYELTLTKSADELGSAFERRLLNLLFGLGEMTAGKRVTLRELKENYGKARENGLILQGLKSDLSEDLQEQGFFTEVNVFKVFVTVFGVTFLVFAGSLVLSSFSGAFTPLVFISIPAGIVALIFLAGGRRTQKGYEALDHLKGFKDFLSVTDKDRFIFHNAPEKNAEQFMEYLPYAIAFGVEKQWAKTFEGITIPNPDWYDGGGGMTSFNAGGLTQSLGAFSTAFAGTSASGSASSGGGSSGGGGGGGGGGSW